MNELFDLDENNKIKINENIKRIRLDIGLSICAPHSKIWIDDDIKTTDDLLIFGFEPNKESILQIKGLIPYQNLWKHRLNPNYIGDKIILINCALGNEEKEVILYTPDGDNGTASTFLPNENIFKVKYTEQIMQYKLSTLFDLFPFDKIPYIEYIKIDAQGSDLNILKSAGDYLTKYVIYITAEPEDNQYYNTNNSEIEMDSYMISQNFIKMNHPNTSDPTYLNKNYEYLKDKINIIQLS